MNQIKKKKKFENIYKCEKYLKLIENLLEKLPFPKLIKQGLKTEINLFPLKIKIRRFLLYCETNYYSPSESQAMALNYGNKIGDDILFFYNEINQLSKINYLVKNEQKISLKGKDDADELYHLLKFNAPRNLHPPEIKSEKDFTEEIKIYSKNFGEPKTKEEIVFKNIFCKDGILLDNDDNRNLYIEIRKKKKKKKKRKLIV